MRTVKATIEERLGTLALEFGIDVATLLDMPVHAFISLRRLAARRRAS